MGQHLSLREMPAFLSKLEIHVSISMHTSKSARPEAAESEKCGG